MKVVLLERCAHGDAGEVVEVTPRVAENLVIRNVARVADWRDGLGRSVLNAAEVAHA